MIRGVVASARDAAAPTAAQAIVFAFTTPTTINDIARSFVADAQIFAPPGTAAAKESAGLATSTLAINDSTHDPWD